LLAAVGRRAVDVDAPGSVGFLARTETEFASEEDVAASRGVTRKPFPHEVFAVAVHVGRVPVGGAEGPSSVQDGEAFFVGAGCVSWVFTGGWGRSTQRNRRRC